MPAAQKEEARIRRYFLVSVVLKGLISLGEMVGGLILLVLPPAFFVGWVISAAQSELLEEPGDFVATHTLALAQGLAIPSGTFIALYLLSRGLIKLGLVAALLKNWLWAYPVSLVVMSLFVLYQCYQIALSGSLLIIAITVFDLVVMYFIWREYLIVKEHLAQK